MRSERELFWMVKLLSGPYVRGRISLGRQKSGCKRDFEQIAGATENDKTFRRFLDVLMEEGCLEFHDRRVERGAVDCFVVNKQKLKERLKANPVYRELKPIIIAEETALGF